MNGVDRLKLKPKCLLICSRPGHQVNPVKAFTAKTGKPMSVNGENVTMTEWQDK